MTAITVSDKRLVAPVSGAKMQVITTSSDAATGYTHDASADFETILVTYLCDSTGTVKVATFSGTTITLGTISTGVHTLVIIGY